MSAYSPGSAEVSNILRKMEKRGDGLGRVASVNFGMQLRDRKRFPADVIKKSTNTSRLTKFHQPCYTGKDIKKYVVTFNDRYCYFNREAKRGGCWDEDIHLAKNKILIKQIGSYPEAGIDTKGYAVLNTAFMIVCNEKGLAPKYLLGLLNSSCVRFFWLNKFTDERKAFPKIKGEYLKLIPIPQAASTQQAQVIDNVNQILAARGVNADADVSQFEHEIDTIFYRLYDLTPDEIAIVEPAQSQ
jgi:hypothetical protein